MAPGKESSCGFLGGSIVLLPGKAPPSAWLGGVKYSASLRPRVVLVQSVEIAAFERRKQRRRLALFDETGQAEIRPLADRGPFCR